MKKLITISLIILIFVIGYIFYPNLIQEELSLKRDIAEFKKDSLVVDSYIESESPIAINYLRSQVFESNKYFIETELPNGLNYKRYIVSYLSEGEKVFALLTVPFDSIPNGGFPAIIFNHGYIPPKSYSTTGNYATYVDYLARNGFVVLKIDMRGHGNSEGLATGSYFSSTYTIDVISALKSLQKSEIINKDRIGVWGHSMSGNLVLRSMLVSDEIKAGVIWAGAVYSYEDFGKYRISDSSFMQRPQSQIIEHKNRDTNTEISKLREDFRSVDFSNNYWQSISLTSNINYLKNPLQIHHSIDDYVVSVNYSRDLAKVLDANSKIYEYFEYPGGGHNITGQYFNQAMQRTVEFFKKNL
jgi:dipeptidyl aminopeptidase/acylaminoacyl peptidase